MFTRFYGDDFGSRIHETLEEPNDDLLTNLVRYFVIDAISKWEKRITLTRVTTNKISPQQLSIELVYNIKESNTQDSVYYNYTL